MNDNDLEKTMPLDDLADIINNDNMEDTLEAPVVETSRVENNNEMYRDLEQERVNEERKVPLEPKDEMVDILETKKGKMFRLKKWWNNLPKKNKILLLVILGLVLILIITIVLYFGLRKEEEEPPKAQPKVEETIVVEDNYIYKDGILSILGSSGEEIGTYECINKDENLCYVAFNSLEDTFDIAVNVYEDDTVIKVRSKVYNDNYVFINDNKDESGVVTLYDLKNQVTIDKYQLVKNVNYEDKSYAIVKNNEGKYGIYDFSEEPKMLVDFKYNYIGYIDGKEYLVVGNDTTYGLIDFTGKEVAKNLSGEIKDYNSKYVAVYELKSYKILNFQGQEIVDNKDDFIDLYDDYYAYVVDDELFYRDYEGNKLYEEGIELVTDNYVGKKVFDANGVKIEDVKSYVGSINNNNLLIDVYDEENESTNYNFDLRDSKLSKDLKYYSYFNGKLYFYEDEEKEELIGSYTCTNKNDVSKEELSTCKVASDTMYEDNYTYYGTRNAIIPIINNRFVFIYDSPLLSNDSNRVINLVNLNNGSTLSTYRSVNTHTDNNDGVLSHVTSADYQVMAQNSNGKYGMISIGLTSATGVYSFDYDYIEKIDNAVSVKNGDTWSIVYNKDLIVGNYPGKIMKVVDDYVIIKKDNKVYLYDEEANAVVDKGFDYISVGNKYFGAVEAGKVYVYDFSGLLISSDGYSLNSTDYLSSDKPVFKFSSSNGKEYIDVLNADKASYSTFEIQEVTDNGE